MTFAPTRTMARLKERYEQTLRAELK